MKKREHSLWIERYRPTSLEGYICTDELREKIKECIEKNDIPHFIFAGPTGTGKTTLAKIIVNNIKCDYLYLNASDENGIDTIREKVKGFASTATFQPLKVVILDEADFLTQPAQAALRNLIEEYSLVTRFVLTCNYVERLIPALHSRCDVKRIVPPTLADVARHVCQNILDKEGVEYNLRDVAQLVKANYPDMRSVIKYLQSDVKDGKYIYTSTNNNWCIQLVEILKKKEKNAWYQVRQLVADSQVDDFQEAYRFLFDNLKEFSNGNDSELSIILDDFIWRAGVVPDKEINFAAAIAKILQVIKAKVL
jgi:replication factor C small subunit